MNSRDDRDRTDLLCGRLVTRMEALFLHTLFQSVCAGAAEELWVDRYAVTFSKAANASSPLDAEGWQLEPPSWSGMPLGDGDTVSLTSVDSSGQLGFLLGKSDAYDEFHELLKVGRVLVDFDPPLADASGAFRQTLHYGNATITVQHAGYHVALWFADGGVLHVEAAREDGAPFSVSAKVDVWRNGTYQVPSYGGGPCGCGACNKSQHFRHADTVVRAGGGDRDPIWFHRNELRPDVFQHGAGSLWEQELRFARLGSAIEKGLSRDPLTNLSFGAALHGVAATGGGAAGGGGGGRSWSQLPAPALGIETAAKTAGPASLRVHVLSAQTDSADDYVSLLRRTVAASPPPPQARAAHTAEWAGIWGRSRLQILRSTNTSQDVHHTTGMFVATRFIALLEQRGGPKKFNGGIFSPDLGALHHYCTDVPAGGVGGQCSADYRGWSGAFWFQNTRHSYWPRLSDADFDTMTPWFDMFTRLLPLAEERSQVWFQVWISTTFPKPLSV
jgi:alpha-L-fucosidase 2